VPTGAPAAASVAAQATPEAPAPTEADQPPVDIAADGSVDLVTVRRMWPDVLEAVKGLRRFTWTLLSHNAQVAAVESGRLTLAMVNAGARDSFARGGSDEIVREALIQVLGVDWKVEAIVDPSASPSGPPPRAAAPGPRTPAGQAGTAATGAAGGAAAWGASVPPPTGGPDRHPSAVPAGEDVPSQDDPDADDAGLTSHDLLARELGAKVIGEYDNG
jgi:DNA polymerase-3 subunit gamma/tau